MPQVLLQLIDQRKLGRKSGEGFYAWRDGKPVRPPAHNTGIPDDLEDRLVLSMLNEAAACLREGVVEDADLLDAGAIFGTGFAPFRGGPLQYARERGVDKVIARLLDLEKRYGKRFHPDAGWSNLSASAQPPM